jgi:oxaloacetate decarboxylase (Na+ extruding) subunit alpha
MSTALRFTDASFTDGQAVVWDQGLTTPMLLAGIGHLANSGLAAIEVLSPSVLEACIARGENPLQRATLAQRRCPGVPLRATVNLLTGHGRAPADVLGPELIGPWLRELAGAGIAQVVLLDALQDTQRMTEAVRAAIAAGLEPIAALPYVADAELDDAEYAQRARALAACGAHRVMLRDESGVLTPDRARSLLPALRAALGELPLDLHTRCQTALGPWLALEAARLGVNGIDTALPCLANGASLPALPLLLRSLARLDIQAPAISQQSLAAANEGLASIADQEGFPAALPWVFDLAPYAHQLPGEVAVRFMAQLRERGEWSRMHAFAAECAAVRADMGSPPMVAPFAQAIAEQAMSHFQGEPRYQSLRPVLRRLLQGVYGTPPGPLNAGLQRRVGRIEAGSITRVDANRASAHTLLAWVAGVAAHEVPAQASLAALRYEAITPSVALARGLLQRAPRYALLSAHGAGIEIRLQLGA